MVLPFPWRHGAVGNEAALYVMSAEIEDARKLRLLEWLLTPEGQRVPDSQRKLAAEFDVSESTIRNWKGDPTFRAHWEKQAKDIVGDPTRIQQAIQDLYDMGRDSTATVPARVKALEVFLRAVDGIKPPALDLARKKAAELTDAELEALTMEAAQRERTLRGAA
jgi:hypothetical protein